MVLSAALHLPTSGWTVAVARHTLGGLLSTSGVAATAGADLILALSEACSNAVRHASAGRAYRVRLRVDDSRCLMEVRDHGHGFDFGAIPAPGRDANGGRGLLIIRAVVDRVDVVMLRPRGIQLTMVKNWNHPTPGQHTDLPTIGNGFRPLSPRAHG